MERRSTRQLHANTTEAVNGVKVIELLQTLKELYMTMYNAKVSGGGTPSAGLPG